MPEPQCENRQKHSNRSAGMSVPAANDFPGSDLAIGNELESR
jgi:hypothetical protein